MNNRLPSTELTSSVFTKGLFIWRWAGPVKRTGSPRWDDFYPTFTWNLLSQFNQKVCYVAEKRLFDKVIFTIRWRKSNMQNKCSYIIWHLKSKTKLIKENTIPPCWAGPLARVHMKNFHLTYVGSRQNQVRSHLGGLAYFWYKHIILLEEFL